MNNEKMQRKLVSLLFLVVTTFLDVGLVFRIMECYWVARKSQLGVKQIYRQVQR